VLEKIVMGPSEPGFSTGVIKLFHADKGYGFIGVEGLADIFFHVSQLHGAEVGKGDTVQFISAAGRNGRAAAMHIQVQQKADTDPRPYYGKPTYKKVGGAPGTGAVIGGIVGGALGPVGAAFGAVIGAALGQAGEREVEITSPCIRCGGTGQVTSRADGLIGFQCKTCRSFWKKRDR
jgi:cold shock CspA family protein